MVRCGLRGVERVEPHRAIEQVYETSESWSAHQVCPEVFTSTTGGPACAATRSTSLIARASREASSMPCTTVSRPLRQRFGQQCEHSAGCHLHVDCARGSGGFSQERTHCSGSLNRQRAGRGVGCQDRLRTSRARRNTSGSFGAGLRWRASLREGRFVDTIR